MKSMPERCKEAALVMAGKEHWPLDSGENEARGAGTAFAQDPHV